MNNIYAFITVFIFAFAATANGQSLNLFKYKSNGCLKMAWDRENIVKSETEFLKTVRYDLSRERCLKDLEKIDFEKSRLYGVSINSGYCRVPVGLEFTATKDIENRSFVIHIRYIKPDGVCRALSRYDLWLILPKPPLDYGVRYEITELARNEGNLQ